MALQKWKLHHMLKSFNINNEMTNAQKNVQREERINTQQIITRILPIRACIILVAILSELIRHQVIAIFPKI